MNITKPSLCMSILGFGSVVLLFRYVALPLLCSKSQSLMPTTEQVLHQRSLDDVPQKNRHLLYQDLDLLRTTETDIEDDDSCREYILTFMNNTFNSHDECTAIHNAYVTALCAIDADIASNDQIAHDLATMSTHRHTDCCDKLEHYYLHYCKTNHDTSADVITTILYIVGALLTCATVKALLKCSPALCWIPDACAYITLGATVTGLFYWRYRDSRHVHDEFYFDEDFFLQILLPFTIFQAALSLDKPSFGRLLGPILLFALVGTALSAVAVGLLVYWLSSGYLPMLESLIFGALISSVDPVATLGILSGVGVDTSSTLYAMIAGESLLNDAVAIVLFETLQDHLGDNAALDQPDTYKSMALYFVTVSLGSVAVAMSSGAAAVLYFWVLRDHLVAIVQVSSFFCWALIPYYVAELYNFSGIIAILTMGFIMDFYVLGGGQAAEPSHRSDDEQHLSLTHHQLLAGQGLLASKCCRQIRFVTHVVSHTMETIIFVYLGLFLFDDKTYSAGLDQLAVWACVFSRAVLVVVLSFIVNVATTSNNSTPADMVGNDASRNPLVLLDRKTQVMLFLAGIRGAVSFALVSNIPVYDEVTELGTHYKAELKAMTSTAILFTLFVFGGLAHFLADRPPTDGIVEPTMVGNDKPGDSDNGDMIEALTLTEFHADDTQDYGATRSPAVSVL